MHDSQSVLEKHAAPRPPAPAGAGQMALENLQSLNFQHLLYFWAVAREGSIAAACERLHVGQPTISMQIRKLEKSLGHRLFDRSSRSMVLTELGRTVFDYADEVFSLGRELLGALRGMPGRLAARLHVGIPTSMPKTITHRLLEPVLQMPGQVQLVCHEGEPDELVAALARHKFDVILSDNPVHSSIGVRCFNHPLGECDIVLCGRKALVDRVRDGFPLSLEGAPLLLPTAATDMRRTLDRWFDELPFAPHIVAEFDDSALMKEFGGAGGGLFPIPSIVFDDIRRQYDVELAGRLEQLRVRYYVVTTERKLTHPATIVIAKNAKRTMPEPTA